MKTTLIEIKKNLQCIAVEWMKLRIQSQFGAQGNKKQPIRTARSKSKIKCG